jgi:2-polyprenyl-6-methoxyphenol hydroxylase-like FAD-dependent oxidoreductase
MITTQVLIIGAGPVGMVSAISLAQAGIRCVMVDKRLDRLDAPKAHAVNARTLEICERIGVSAAEVRAAGASVADGGLVHFVDTLSGSCFGSLPYERQDEGAKQFTPWPLVNIPQPRFEAFLNARLTHCEGVSLLRGVSATQLEQDGAGVTVVLNGDGFEALEVRSDYVIAADGANSATRDQLGIGLTGPEGLAHNMMIHFEADLTGLTREHPGLLYFCLSPAASGVFIGYQRDRTWVFMQPYDPGSQTRNDFDDATCRQLVEAAAGTALDDFKVRNVSPWTMSAQVADAYGKGRVFLAGDAAHRFPPTGGLGLNTGVADAQNLAWKLALVVKGAADAALLDTYEAERRPVAQINTHQSLTNSAKMFEMFEAVYGDDPENLAEHYARACANPGLAEIRQAVEVQRPHFDSFNLQLGYRYGEDVAPDDIDVSCYLPRFEAGDFLPLIALEDGPWLLGLLPNDAFALVTGPDGAAWQCDDVSVFTEGADFKPGDSFSSRAGLAADGALLIRPDGHIAARWESAPDNPAAAVQHCLGTLLAGKSLEKVA